MTSIALWFSGRDFSYFRHTSETLGVGFLGGGVLWTKHGYLARISTGLYSWSLEDRARAEERKWKGW